VRHFALHVAGRVEAGEGVLALLSLLESDVLSLVAGLEAAHEDHGDLALALTFAADRGLFFSDNPVAILVEFKIFAENAWFARADDVHWDELVVLGLLVDLRLHLQAVIETSLEVLGEHEAESQVLLVGEIGSVEDKFPVELASALVDLGVSLEELELHGVASRVVEGALSDHVVHFHVRAVGCLLHAAV